jgi:hypothetical protein
MGGIGNHNYNTTKSSKRRPQLKHIEEYKPNNSNLGMSGITSKLSGSEIVEPVQPSSASIPAANPSVLALGP